MKNTTRKLVRAGVIAALYAALTLILRPFSFGAVQLRLSEALMLLPVLMPESIGGLAVGCLLANLLGGAALPDIVFGSLATLLSAILVRRLRANRLFAALMPVLGNGVIVGAVVWACYLNAPDPASLFLTMLTVAAGEAAACALGLILIRALEKRLPNR